MKDSKINKLFEAARREEAPAVPFGFSQRVVSAIGRNDRSALAPSVFDQLSQLFPRIAVAALVVIGGCIAMDWYLTQKEAPLAASVEQVSVSDEWMFAAK